MRPINSRAWPAAFALAGIAAGVLLAAFALGVDGAGHTRAAGGYRLVVANLASDDAQATAVDTTTTTATATATATATSTTTPAPSATQAGTCGASRWLVKTLADADAAAINRTPITRGIKELTELARPAGLTGSSPRQQPDEFKTYTVTGLLVSMRERPDRDVELVVADSASSATLVVKFPRNTCIPASANPEDAVAQGAARRVLTTACGAPPSGGAPVSLTGAVARITGVGFFEPGGGFELHPATAFELATPGPCNRALPSPTATGTAGGPVQLILTDPGYVQPGQTVAITLETSPPTPGLVCRAGFSLPPPATAIVVALGNATTGADGRISYSVTVPPDSTTGGAGTFAVSCDSDRYQAQTLLRVQ